MVPYALSISPLDCESLNVMYGFDFTYRGNHNQLLVDALGVQPAFEKIDGDPGRDDAGQRAVDPIRPGRRLPHCSAD